MAALTITPAVAQAMISLGAENSVAVVERLYDEFDILCRGRPTDRDIQYALLMAAQLKASPAGAAN